MLVNHSTRRPLVPSFYPVRLYEPGKANMAVSSDGGGMECSINTDHVVMMRPGRVIGQTEIVFFNGVVLIAKEPEKELRARFNCNTSRLIGEPGAHDAD